MGEINSWEVTLYDRRHARQKQAVEAVSLLVIDGVMVAPCFDVLLKMRDVVQYASG